MKGKRITGEPIAWALGQAEDRPRERALETLIVAHSRCVMSSRAHDPSGRPHGLRPSGQAAGVVALVAALTASATLASPILYLARNEVLCDSRRIACVDGTLSYEVNTRLLELRGRVQFTTVPGVLQIVVKGSNRLGHVRYAPMEIKLRGQASEIVDFRMIPDYPDVENWAIDHISFLPAKNE